MSKPEELLGELLRKEYANYRIFPQLYLKYLKRRLFFDYAIPELGLYFEFDGRQHDHYSAHFHHTRSKFEDAKYRDRLKEQWARENGFTVIRFKYNDKVSIQEIRAKVQASLPT